MSARMPDLTGVWRGARHTVTSAIPALLKLGIDIDRIQLTSAGPGTARGTVVSQSPAPGAELTSESRIRLGVAGAGMMERLPFPMRDGADGEFRIDQLVGLFDDPFLKLEHYIKSAGGLLDLHPDDRAASARWISELFGVDHRQWAPDRWYDVARLLPALPRIAGRPDGPALALRAVFRLPAGPARVITGMAAVREAQRTRLGVQNGRLGIDALIGEGVPSHVSVEVTIGPVELATWAAHRSPVFARERRALYQLVLPAHLRRDVTERWVVGDRSQATRLEAGGRNVALGINSYLGGAGTRSNS